MNPYLELVRYPRVQKWLEQCQNGENLIHRSSEKFLYKIALLLKSESKKTSWWLQLLEDFSNDLDSKDADLSESIILAQSMDCDLMQIISHLTEESVVEGLGEETYRHLDMFAKRTTHLGLRFLTAWTAFNIDRFRECLEHCEPILDRFSDVYLLAGQAHMNLGEGLAAIETLNVATALAPQDINTWFLLSKAYLINENIQQAIKTIVECVIIDPTDIESCFLALIIASNNKCDQDSRIKILELTETRLMTSDVPIYCFLKYIEVYLLEGNHSKIHDFLRKKIEKKTCYKLEHNYQIQNLSKILKILGKQNDYNGTQLLLDCLTCN